MKYVGKVDGDNYLFSISEEEILQLMYGETHAQYNDKLSGEVSKFRENLRYGKVDEIKPHEKFNRMIKLCEAQKRVDDWNELSKKMDDMKRLFQPVVEYLEKLDK